MNTLQIVVKTIASTLNILIGWALVKSKDTNSNMFKGYIAFMLMNLIAMWV